MDEHKVIRISVALFAIALGLCVGLLAGCSGMSYPQRFHYRNLNLNFVKGSREAVDRHCRKYAAGGHYDDGVPVAEGDGRRVRCCFKRSRSGHRPTIFVSEDDLDCVAHELCHVDGRPARDCHTVGFNKGGLKP